MPTSVRPKIITAAVAAATVMSSPYPAAESTPSLLFLTIFTVTHLFIRIFLKHRTSFWLLILFFIEEEFFRLVSVTWKKFKNTIGKDRKFTNAIDFSIV